MSRIGKQPIAIPAGVEVKLEGNLLKFKKGNLAKELDTKANVNVEIKDNNILFSPKGEDRQSRAYWGTYRALAYNIVVGLTQGFSKTLEINGVGYKAALKGKVSLFNTPIASVVYFFPVVFKLLLLYACSNSSEKYESTMV